MKKWGKPFLIITLAIIFLLTVVYFQKNKIKKSRAANLVTQNQVASKKTLGLPIRLTIPVINVNANVQHIGLTTTGDMQVPTNTIDVGWFDLGPRPGERGSAVIGGHFNNKNGEEGVFADLDKLKQGDKVYVEDSQGKTITFIVQESRTYDPGYAEEVFSLSDSEHLNLITCEGKWDAIQKSYSKRLVVFTNMEKQNF